MTESHSTQPGAETDALSDLIQPVVREVAQAVPLPAFEPRVETIRGLRALNRKRGVFNKTERLRVVGFERYCAGAAPKAIAQELECTSQHVYHMIKSEDWVGRRSKLQAMALLDQGAAAKALEMAVAELQSKIPQRLLELNRLCEKGNVRAIELWGKWAGLNGKIDLPDNARVVEIHNDLSDRRQVRVVQHYGPAPEEETSHDDHPDQHTP